MGRGLTKAERLREMERLYLQRAYSDIEMAQRLDVDRTTVYRHRLELEQQVPFIQDEDGRWRIDRTRYLSNIRVNLAEALSLYLAARRASQQTRIAHTPVASALEKLALSLRQPMTERLVRAAEQILRQRQDSQRTVVFETIAQAWSEQRQLRLHYRALRDGVERVHHLTPYLIEPSPWTDGVYLIGHSREANRLLTLKLDRIVQAALLGPFELPASFDEQELLRHAWGIWGSEEAPQVVKLRFAPGLAARRLRESVWHPLEKVKVLPDGGCEWEAPIAEWQEMLPWIRGWGADVEVLEPPELRETIMGEARRLGELYQMVATKPQFFAHIRERDRKPQLLQDHLSEVAELTGRFAQKVGLREAGRAIGLLHDLGKASDRFQKYLLSGEGLIAPDAEEYIDPVAHKGKIDHTTAGAQVVYQHLWDMGGKEKIAAQFMALCIASHHSGLIDCITPAGENSFRRRMEKLDESTRKTEALGNLPEIQASLDNMLSSAVVEQIYIKLKSLQQKDKDSQETSAFKAGLLLRFLLSCLIDADRLNTADFEIPGNVRLRNYGQYRPWEALIQRLDDKLREFERKANRNEVDRLRSQVSLACLEYASKPKGIYQLTVPTGGGKTLASLRFALNHAACHKMDRIFYIIPYTSIIDQNAEEVRKILEDRDEQGHYLDTVILEHHSNLTPEEATYRQSLLAQNWDAPIVFTTQVQFLEALFGGGTQSVRRMHQLANSVIVLDEVQTIPIKTVHMLNSALAFLVNDCGATVVLCTATQPPLDKLDAQYRSLTIQPDRRIIQNEHELFERLKRVNVVDVRKVEGWSKEEIADLARQQLAEQGSVLIVVNTRKAARELYQAIGEMRTTQSLVDVELYHLSTNMCPIHRLKVLDEVKGKLQRQEPVICVSTQLIEAGVDIDFGSVIRYLAGLDSIAQSAGRCNRHGTRIALGNVWIVNPQEESLGNLEDIKIGIEQALRVLDDFNNSPQIFENDRIGVEAMAAYYRYYYHRRKGDMTYKVGPDSSVGRDDTLFNLLAQNTKSVNEFGRIHKTTPDIPFRQSFQTASKVFRVIDAPTRGVIVQYGDEGKRLVAELCSDSALGQKHKLLRKAQRYSVNLLPYEFERLVKIGALHEVQEGTGLYYLDERYYSDKFGWSDEPISAQDTLIVE